MLASLYNLTFFFLYVYLGVVSCSKKNPTPYCVAPLLETSKNRNSKTKTTVKGDERNGTKKTNKGTDYWFKRR